MENKKLDSADVLIKSGNVEKGLKIYRIMCSDHNKPVSLILARLFSIFKEEALEILIKLRDSFPFLDEAGKARLVKILEEIGTLSPARTSLQDLKVIPVFERMVTGTFLYNHLYLKESMAIFISIASDPEIEFVYRIDSCKYMFGSTVPEYKEKALSFLSTILDNTLIESIIRYRVIVNFSSKSGITTYINKEKIKTPYDEEFVYNLQILFFMNEKNGIRERILSAQSLLQMDSDVVQEEKREQIVKKLLEMSTFTNYEENVRADAADVVLRLGNPEEREIARTTIQELGYSSVKTFKTIYNNSQNVHDEHIESCVAIAIEKLMKGFIPRSYTNIKDEISTAIRDPKYSSKRILIWQALNRIELDSSTYSSTKSTLAEILAMVWSKIKGCPQEELLLDRLVEELVDMSDTCASGHAGRLINVFSGILDGYITISFKTQISANISARLIAKMKELEEDERDKIIMGMLPMADEEDRETFLEFIKEQTPNIKEELYKEFVLAKYITENEFNVYFESTVDSLINGKIPSSVLVKD